MRVKSNFFRGSVRLNGIEGSAFAFFLFALTPFAVVLSVGNWSGVDEVFASGAPKVTVSPAVVEYKRRVDVLISGSGFAPGMKLKLLVPMREVPTDIGFLLTPEPETNEYGAFSSLWRVDREIREKLLEPIAYTLEVLDGQGNTVATAPLVFCDLKAEKKSAACAMLDNKK